VYDPDINSDIIKHVTLSPQYLSFYVSPYTISDKKITTHPIASAGSVLHSCGCFRQNVFILAHKIIIIG